MAFDPDKPTVIVIGAGAAGLAAAERLHETGKFNVRVLEAQDRTGGRVFSQHCGAPGSKDFIELGAQWIHGEDHAIFAFAKQHDLVLEKSRDSLVDEDEATGEFVLNTGRPVTEDEKEIVQDCLQFLNSVLASMENAGEMPADQLNGRSMGDYVDEKFQQFLTEKTNQEFTKLRKAAYDWFLRYQLVDNACLSLHSDLSIRAFSDYGLVGDATVRLKVPLSDLLQRIFPTFPVNRIELNRPVTKITFSDTHQRAPLTVHCADEQVLRADHVIMTVSLGVLKASPELFQPPLPDWKRQAIEACGFGTISKLLLEFPRPFWDEMDPPTDGFQFLWFDAAVGSAKSGAGQNPVPWYRYALGLDAVRTSKNMLVLWVAGPSGPVVDALPDDRLLTDSWTLLCQFAGSTEIPKPTRLIRERWSTNPYTMGTYSYYSLNSSRGGIAIDQLSEPIWQYTSPTRETVVPALLFAGEATHPKYFSTVHGAILTGWREADRLIALLKEPQVQKDEKADR